MTNCSWKFNDYRWMQTSSILKPKDFRGLIRLDKTPIKKSLIKGVLARDMITIENEVELKPVQISKVKSIITRASSKTKQVKPKKVK